MHNYVHINGALTSQGTYGGYRTEPKYCDIFLLFLKICKVIYTKGKGSSYMKMCKGFIQTGEVLSCM
jgi:hypothetical protein